MEIIILVVIMILVGLVIAALAGALWKNERPAGMLGDVAAAIVTAVIIGLIDWYVIPAMNFSDTMKYLGVAIEPALGALIVLWAIRKVKPA
jgi:uncharacterized membrane protein YeaQ/YmgE (transglycosylase-associated protein family)